MRRLLMEPNPYIDLFKDQDYALAPDIESMMVNQTTGDDPDLPERVRELVERAAADAGKAPRDYEVWHHDQQTLIFPRKLRSPSLPDPIIDLT